MEKKRIFYVGIDHGNHLMKSANHVFFYDGWSKSGLSSKGTKEIEDDELAA